MYHLSAMIGKSVVASDTGEKVGTIADGLLDPEATQLLGLVIDNGVLATEHVLPLSDVATVGRDAVLVRTGEHMMTPGDWRRAQVEATRCSAVTGRRVVTTDGEELGHVSDLLFDERTGALGGLEVEERSLKGLRRKRRVIQAPPTPRVGPDAVVLAPADPS